MMDNLSTHSATDVLLFALAHPRWEFVFQPKYAAYLNLIEPWWKIVRCRVEVPVTRHLPHRSRRAACPHRALVEGQTRSKVRSLASHKPPIRRLAASVTRRARL